MNVREVVVTGMGAVSALGADLPSTLEALAAGRSGVCLVDLGGTGRQAPAAPVRLGEAEAGWRRDRRLERSSQLGLIAAREAWREAGLAGGTFDPLRSGVHVGIGLGGADTVDDRLAQCAVEGDAARWGPNPLSVIRAMPNALAGWLSIEFGLRGPSHTSSLACASSAVALGEAMRCIRHGYADRVLVVGAEAMLFPGTWAAWDAMRVMAPPDPAAPEASVRPFDLQRKGFVLGEGAAAVVLESAEVARRRGARALARMAGYGIASDADHITRPHRQGQVQAMRLALAEEGTDTAALGYLNAHGTATAVGDRVECEAIREALGDHARRVAVSSTKSMHGHLMGAGGALEFAVAVHALRTGVLPPTAHLVQPDPACDLDHVAGAARRVPRPRRVMSNSFAFGGTNVSLLVAPADA